MSKGGKVDVSLEFTEKTRSLSPLQPIFVLCDKCYWCATWLDKTTGPRINNCPQCGSHYVKLSSFPILSTNHQRVIPSYFKL